MIRSITWDQPLIVGTSGSYAPTYGSPGAVRWNPNKSCLEADVNGVWHEVGSNSHISLDYTTQNVLKWAMKKMEEEQKFLEIIKLHPEIKEMKDKLELAVALVREYD